MAARSGWCTTWRALGTIALTATAACTTITLPPPSVDASTAAFSHAELDALLQRVVDARGLVDYSRLEADHPELDRYLARVAAVSPDSHPARFPTEASRLVYWINAYNAAAIKTVLEHYPIASVTDISRPWLFFFLPRASGFFAFHRLRYGRRAISLYDLENDIVRKRFGDPRIHFALNCASLGCPRLPARVFSATELDAELDRETRAFVAEARNVRIDDAGNAIWLSEIFDWYEDDFVEWDRGRHPNRAASLIDYIAAYLPEADAARLREAAATHPIRFTPYDWRLNDQKTAPTSR